jgi:hypothetical protein
MDFRDLGTVRERLAVARRASLVGAIIAGFPKITAKAPPFSLVATTGQSSYPLNSENAKPPGTSTVYLS